MVAGILALLSFALIVTGTLIPDDFTFVEFRGSALRSVSGIVIWWVPASITLVAGILLLASVGLRQFASGLLVGLGVMFIALPLSVIISILDFGDRIEVGLVVVLLGGVLQLAAGIVGTAGSRTRGGQSLTGTR